MTEEFTLTSEAAKELSKLGAAKGGNARAKALTAEQRSAIARAAVEERWRKQGKLTVGIPVATHGSVDRPLRIGGIEIPAYVLPDGTRVLAQRGLQSGIGMSEGGRKKDGERRITALMARLADKGIDVRGLIARTNSPIKFIPPHGGNAADGYDATILPDICAVLIDAQQKGALSGKHQKAFAERAAILQHGFATVGIVALVDEATGYQEDRAKNALAQILEAFIAKELRKWVSTFPVDYYKELFRLRGWRFPDIPKDQQKRPVLVGKITNDVVYDRLAPGVRQELQRLTPRNEKGKLKHKLFQHLTDDVGHPKLREHLASVTTLMKAADSWDQFKKMLDRSLPRYGDTPYLPFEG